MNDQNKYILRHEIDIHGNVFSSIPNIIRIVLEYTIYIRYFTQYMQSVIHYYLVGLNHPYDNLNLARLWQQKFC